MSSYKDEREHNIRGISVDIFRDLWDLGFADIAKDFLWFRSQVTRSGKGYDRLSAVTSSYEHAITTYKEEMPRLEKQFEQAVLKGEDRKKTKEIYAQMDGLKKRLREEVKETTFSMHGKRRGLPSVFSIIGIVSILAGLIFLSSNITGNVIGNMANSTSNWVGGVLFIIGLIGTFFYFRKR